MDENIEKFLKADRGNFSGRLLNKIRISLNLSQEELANLIKVSHRALISWEKGKIPSFSSIKKLKSFFETILEEQKNTVIPSNNPKTNTNETSKSDMNYQLNNTIKLSKYLSKDVLESLKSKKIPVDTFCGNAILVYVRLYESGLLDRVKELASINGRSPQGFITEIVMEYLDKQTGDTISEESYGRLPKTGN